VVTDPADPGTPQTIIERDDDFHVIVNWNLTGPLAPFMAGEFTVKVYVEDIAATNYQGQIGPTMIVNLNEAPPVLNRPYHRDFTITHGTIPAGVYRLTTVLTYANLGVPLEMAGFAPKSDPGGSGKGARQPQEPARYGSNVTRPVR
jgi:hypothetical protein